MKTALFTYPDYGTPCGFPEHASHSGQRVKILERVESDDVEMYRIQAPDGWVGEAFEDELSEFKDNS